MKKLSTLILILSFGAALNKLQAQCSNSPTFTHYYSKFMSAWTHVNQTNHTANYLGVSAGVFNFSNASGTVLCGREQRAYMPIPVLNDKFWVAECKLTITGGNAASAAIMSFTSGTKDTWYEQTDFLTECTDPFSGTNTNQDAIFALLTSAAPSSTTSSPITSGWGIYAGYKDGLSATNTASTSIPINALGTYYVRLTRTDYGSGLISVFSNAAMTTHVTGSPQCFTINPSTAISGLSYVQHGVAPMGNCMRSLLANVDDLRLYNGQSPCPLVLTPVITANTTYCYGSPVNVSGSLSTSGSTIPISSHVWITNECDANGNNISGTEVWGPFISGAPVGNYTIPASLLACDKYYNVGLAVQNCGNIWASTTKKIHVVCSPTVKLIGDNAYCQGSTIGIGVNAYGTVAPYTCSWYTTAPNYSSIVSNVPMQSISATPSVNTTYGITVTDANGCSTSATKAITLAPQNLNLDITTGKNSSNNFIQFQQPDDDWKIVNFPGQTDYSWFGTPYAVDPVSLYAPGGLTNWVSSSNARWITSDYYGNGPSPFATASVYPTPNAKNARYFYEYAFNLPVAYSNLKVNINELAVDNNADIYMNTDYLISGNSTNNLEYSLSGYSIGNYSSIHGPLASIATTQSHYNIGLNKLDIVIGNGGGGPPNGGNYSYSGLLLNGSITGTCSPTQRLASSYVDQNVLNVLNEGNDIASLFSIYPNPAVDVLSINYLLKNSDKANVMILDITGTIKFKSQIDSESSKMDINLSEFSAGFYFVCVERNGIIIKKEKIVLAK